MQQIAIFFLGCARVGFDEDAEMSTFQTCTKIIPITNLKNRTKNVGGAGQNPTLQLSPPK